MKVIAVFVLLIATAAAFPSAEKQADTKSEQQNTPLLKEGSPRGGNGESEVHRNKRFISIPLPNLFDPLSVPNINIDVSSEVVQKTFVSPPPTSIDSIPAAIRVKAPFVDVSVGR